MPCLKICVKACKNMHIYQNVFCAAENIARNGIGISESGIDDFSLGPYVSMK